MTARTTMKSPLGDLLLTGEETADGFRLRSLSLAGRYSSPPRYWVGGEYGPGTTPPGRQSTAGPFAAVVRQLDAYFAGELTRFDMPFATTGSDFQRRVWHELDRIPYGTTTTYGALAARLGLARDRVQALGAAIGANPLLVVRPCHRVIGADGSMRGYAGGVANKVWLLTHEGALQPSLL
ncbi:methylated-DNA--[protein]-cysteine S-methyltransferase [Actinoplanes sp. CA-030573]|uniref:methylated-DNA--[protein]-cysteine S-methyltransferase n=1 Tax=Actinoplanes sp. CA-030573 TaxID=3239898 RepID=UPI003D8B51AC